MPIHSGAHKLGPDDATLRVKTGRRGAAAKAGHDLVIEVTSWEATLNVGEVPGQISLELNADAGSLQVREGTGGSKTEADKVEIKQTIDDEVLAGQVIEFRSTDVEATEGGSRLRVRGELSMNGNRHPIAFELTVSPDGQVVGGATLKQSG